MITTVVEFGCFVQLLDVGVDGLLHLTALSDDEYQMTRDGGAVGGQAAQAAASRRARGCASSSPRCNPVEGMIDLELADEPSAGKP